MFKYNRLRRKFLQFASLFGAGMLTNKAQAHHTDSHFDDSSPHKVVFQCNKVEPEYLGHILFSAGGMLRKYGNDIEIVITTFGRGVNLLGKKPVRTISKEHRERAASLAAYGVAFHICHSTMKALNWTKDDIADYAKVVPAGAIDLMTLQEKGFSYISE